MSRRTEIHRPTPTARSDRSGAGLIEGPSADKARLRWLKTLQPFLLLLATALISGYLLPRIQRQAQEHQKELELKSTFVSDITRSVSGILLAVQFAESGYAAQSQEQFDKAYQTWETDKLVIAAQLQVHFGAPSLHERWAKFSEMVTEVYALTGTRNEELRAQRIDKLKGQLTASRVDWDTLLDLPMRSADAEQFHKYYGAWFSLRTAVYEAHSEFLRGLLDSKMTMFGS